jgi:hypothetical protein
MIADGKSAGNIRDYITYNKFRNIAGDLNMPDKEVGKIIELLDETDPKGIFKELNSELRKMLNTRK